MMESEVYEREGALIIAASGKLDTVNAPQLLKSIEAVLQKKPQRVILDLGEVTFLSSSGLQVLLSMAKRARHEGFHFAVCGMQGMVRDVFVMSGFDRFIKEFPSLQEVKAYFDAYH